MLDINKIRSNYPKFSVIKQKCDPVVSKQQQKTNSRSLHQSQQHQQPSSSQFNQTKSSNKTTINNLNSLNTISKLRQPTRTTTITNTNTNTNTSNNKSILNLGTKSLKNSVREANQQFFLVSSYQDQNFLRAECELAHAQVSTNHASTGTKTISSSLNKGPSSKKGDNQSNNINNNTTTTNSKTTSNHSHNHRHHHSNINNSNTSNNNNLNRTSFKSANIKSVSQLSRSAPAALPVTTNGMRRQTNTSVAISSFTNCNGTTTTNTTTITNNTTNNSHTISSSLLSHNKNDMNSTNLKPVAVKTSKNSISTNHHKQLLTPVRPLVHRTIPSTIVLSSDNNKTNNNTNSNSNSNKDLSLNNNMQQLTNISTKTAITTNNTNITTNTNIAAISNKNNIHSDRDDDIKFIDCDEVLTNTTTANPSIQRFNQNHVISNNSINITTPSTNNMLTKAKIRPKSTIITTSTNTNTNNLVFEKVNNYKYDSNETIINASTLPTQNLLNSSMKNISKSSNTTNTTTNQQHQLHHHRNELKASGIDHQSIKASIAKFNNYNERKIQPSVAPTAVTLRSSANSGSINNLQHHRHSTELDNNSNNNRLFNTATGSSSLTRSPYRSTATTTNLTTHHTSSATAKVLNNIQSIASTISPTATSNHGLTKNTNSLPLKSNKHFEYTTGSLSKDIRTQAVLNAKAAASASVAATSKHIDRDLISSSNDESIRDAVRSTLPPSPTSTKYWDRDSNRYSALSSYDTDTKTSSASYNEKREGLCGLRNIGNTCFMNSVIQCLSHTTELTRFLRSYTAIRTSTKDQHILYEFAKLIREMWSGTTNIVTPSELKRSFSAKHRMYSDYNQQDAQEFLRFFLDSLHSALNTGVKGELLRIDDHLSDNAKAEATWEWYTRIENSLIRDLFVGQLKSTLRCTTCGNTSVTFDPFWDLSVSLPTSSRCKLDACLDLFIREEILDGDEMPTCSKCKTRRKCTKSFTIQRFPKYLVIHLKRFSEARWSKLTNIVEFPTGEHELNMGPYGSNSNSNIYYSLYGVSNHMGSTAGGHYVAVCKHPISKKWHEFNDNIVSGSVPESQIVSSSAYILFYERA